MESWEEHARVAVVASGGLSHFVIDEDLDHQVFTCLENRNAAGATEHLKMQLVDYVPCYRSLAGTGCAMGFAQWT